MPPRTNEETIAKYAVDANLFRLGSTNPKKNIQAVDAFWLGAKSPTKKKLNFFFRNVSIFEQINFLALSQLMIYRSPPLSFDPVLWMMRNVLNGMKNLFSNFFYFYFSSYREKIIEKWGDDATK